MTKHWTRYLTFGFPSTGEDSEVTLTVNPKRDNRTLISIAARLPMLFEAFRAQPFDGEPDPLLAERPGDLLLLLGETHRLRMYVEGLEERVLMAAHQRGVSMQDLAYAVERRNRQSMAYRLKQIKSANERGLTAAALDEDALD